ncbi:MAG: glycosyltransferase family 4 protein, partial [Anaerolineae bacterium]
DSKTHFQFFADYLKCPWTKFRRLPFGVDDRMFYPRQQTRSDDHFQVLFYGKYQPLQGVVTIIEAAKRLENDPDVRFLVIGYGPTWHEVQQRAQELRVQNVRFLRWVDFDQLPEVISQADVCLGVFGVSDKIDRCIANKVVQALAMRKPVITGYTKAMGEVLNDREQVLFCERGNPQALAEAIVELKENADLREKIAAQGYEAFLQYFSPSAIGAMARRYLEEMIGS